MKYKKIPTATFCLAATLLALTSCNNGTEKKIETTVKKDSVVKEIDKKEEIIPAKKAPVINIMDTLSTKFTVLCMKDSAANSDRIAIKLAAIYNVKLAAIVKKNGLKVIGAPMAWYKSQKAPFFFEAGLPVNKIPGKLPANLSVKQIGVDSVIVAHFYGPYDLTGQAYTVLEDWIKDHKKKAIHPPYEVYVEDPMDKNGKLKDPYKVQTDIVFTWK
jgi:effector-binding domain-containing protein